MNFIRFTIWPWLKVKLLYYWWIIRYRGKKNIPPRVIFGQLTKTMEGLKDNLGNAFALSKDDMNKGEFLDFSKLMGKVDELEKEIKSSISKD